MKKIWVTMALSATLLGPVAVQVKALGPIGTVKAFDAAMNAGDKEKGLSYFADDAVIALQMGPGKTRTYQGKEQIKGFVENNIGGLRVASVNFKAEGNKVTWQSTVSNDNFRKMGMDSGHFDGSAVVENGKIKSFTPSLTAESVMVMKAAGEAANKAALRGFVDTVLNGHNPAAADALVTPDFLDHDPIPGTGPDLAGMKKGFQEFFAAFPDFKATVVDTLAEGDKAVVLMKTQGAQTGEFMGKPATGLAFNIEEIHMVRFVDGKVAEHWGQADAMTMMQQLTPPAPPTPAPKKKK